jgi:putative DNA primase/helicase
MDEFISQYRNSRGKLDTYSLAERLLEDYHVINLRDRLYIYDNGIYVYNPQKLESAIRTLGRGAKLAEINTTLKDLFSMAPIREETNYEYVAFNNCIINIKTLETFDFDYNKYIITSKVYADYNVDVLTTDVDSVGLVDQFFNDVSCNDVELQDFLFEMIGYCMLRTSKYQRAFILKGNASNGKSDYIHIIDNLLGNYCTHEDLSQLSNLNNLKKLYQRTANIIDDVTELSRVDFARLHSIITGGNIATKNTGDEEFAFKPYATLILATTHFLDFSSCNDETIRRFRVVPFGAKFDSNSVDRNMTEKITSPSSLNIIATKAIQAMSKVTNDLHIPDIVEATTNNFFFQGNPVLAFVKSHPIKRMVCNTEYYREYAIWCSQNDIECDITIAQFGTKVLDLTSYIAQKHSIGSVVDTFYHVPNFNLEKLRQQYKSYCDSPAGVERGMTLLEYIKYLDSIDEQN